MKKHSLSQRIWNTLPWAANSFFLLFLLTGGWMLTFRALWELPVTNGQLWLWCALLSLFSAGLWLLPRKVRWCLLGLIAAAGLFILWRWEMLLPGLRELLIRTAAPLSQIFPALYIPPGDSSLTAVLPGCFLVFAALAALLLGFFVSLRCWWAAMAFSFLPVLPTILAGEMPSWAGFLLLLAGSLPLLFTSLFRQEEPRSLGWSGLLSLAMSFLLLLSLTVVLPQDTYKYPQWAKDMREHLLDITSSGLDGVMDWELPSDLPSGGGSGSISQALSVEQVDLSAMGPRRFTGRTMLEVEGTTEGRVYLRGSSSALYTGSSWEPLPGEAYQGLGDAISTSEAMESFLFPAYYLTGADTASLTIRHTTMSDTTAYVPYQPDVNTPEVLSPVRDAYFSRHAGQNVYTLSYYPEFLPEYSAISDLEYAYRNHIYQYYLFVPQSTADILAPLASRLGDMEVQVPEGLADDYYPAVSKALQVAQLLGQTAVYDLNTPAMEAGDDFVAHFLEEGRGYCVHFATTAVLLLRMQGIPARYVSGYTAYVTPGETVQVPDSAAHAWVEIYLNDYGWYPVEVTPGGAEAAANALQQEEPDQPEQPIDEKPQPVAPDVPVQPWEDAPAPETDSEPAPEPTPHLDLHWLLIPLCVLLLAAAAYGAERLAVYLRRREESNPDTNASVLSAYRRYCRLQAMGAGEDTVLEDLSRKAKFSQHTLTEEERSLAWQRLSAAAAPDAVSQLPWWKKLPLRLLSRY